MASELSRGVLVGPPPFAPDIDIPAVDIPTYIFSSGNAASRQVPQYFNAANPERHFSLQEAELCVKRFAKGLQDLGLGRQDKVLLCSGNDLYFPVLLWGVLAAGCVFTGASPTASVFELSHQARDSEAKLILAAPAQLGVARQAAAKCGLDTKRIFVFGDPADRGTGQQNSQGQNRHWKEIWASEEQARPWKWDPITSLNEAQSTTAVLNYSSGTTGLPKGVELSHLNLVANVEQLVFKRTRVAETDHGRSRAARLAESGERWLAPLPMYHAYGQIYYAMIAPRLSAKVFIMNKFDLVSYLTFIDIYRITFINAVPVMLQRLSKVPNPERFNLKSVRFVSCGAAPLDIGVARQIERIFLGHGVGIRQGWGMTETTCNVTGFSPDDVDDGRSVGWVNSSCRVRIVPVPDRDFSNVEREHGAVVGEIWASGPNVTRGYWKRPEATADTVVEHDGRRWLRTGDIGFADRRGCLYIVDRIKELIKVNGLQVSPAELEGTLLSHPGVSEAAVVGANLAGRESPRAFVVKKDPAVTAENLSELIETRLARHKWLTGGIFFVDSIPRTASGKIVKRKLPNVNVRPRL